MTEQQIEAAARLLCEKRGINPDYYFYAGTRPKDALPNWQIAAKEIRAHYEVLTSIATVMDMEGE